MIVPCHICGAAPIPEEVPENMFPSSLRCPNGEDGAHLASYGSRRVGKTPSGAVRAWNRLHEVRVAKRIDLRSPPCPRCGLMLSEGGECIDCPGARHYVDRFVLARRGDACEVSRL
jgi:hypothetical protein